MALSGLLGFLVTLLIVALIYWAVTKILSLFPLPSPIGEIINIILVVILAIIVINALLALFGAGTFFPHSILR